MSVRLSRLPRNIAHRLNAEGIAGPRGTGWGPSTIHGSVKRRNGILNNELYIGRIVWNRQRFIKDPDTGKRVSRPNPEEEWITRDVPKLRIVGYSVIFRDILGCSAVKNKGTCSNTTRITRHELEARILDTLREHLMTPDKFELFCKEYTHEVNRLRRVASAGLSGKRAELKKVDAQIEKMIQAIMDGFYSPAMKEKMPVLEGRKAELVSELGHATEPPALLHPAMAQEYRKRIDGLIEALANERTRL